MLEKQNFVHQLNYYKPKQLTMLNLYLMYSAAAAARRSKIHQRNTYKQQQQCQRKQSRKLAFASL